MNAVFKDDARRALAPTGVLRASINVGNPILAGLSPDGSAFGISVDLSTRLAAMLDVALQHLVFESAAKSFAAVSAGAADVGFFALDPARATEVLFTEPYVLIEGAYMVRNSSCLQVNEDVDRPGHRVVVGAGSAYDLHLSRTLADATLLRAPTSPAVTDTFLAEGAEVAAGVRQQLASDMRTHSGLRLLPGRFMVIQQAMGVAKARGDVAAEWVRCFVEDAKASGFVLESMQRHGILGASVAP